MTRRIEKPRWRVLRKSGRVRLLSTGLVYAVEYPKKVGGESIGIPEMQQFMTLAGAEAFYQRIVQFLEGEQ